MKGSISISISRSGLHRDSIPLNDETIALHIPSNKKEADTFKEAYVKRMKEQGIVLSFQKDIHYKKPFWKFWGLNDYSIAIYKIDFN